MEERSEEDWQALQDCLVVHAVATVMASEFLAASSPTTTPENWLDAILARAKSEYSRCNSDQLKEYVTKTLTAMKRKDVSP